MGEMADYALEQQENWDTDFGRPPRRHKYPSNDEDDEQLFAKPRSKFTRTCKICGVSGLQWVDTDQGVGALQSRW